MLNTVHCGQAIVDLTTQKWQNVETHCVGSFGGTIQYSILLLVFLFFCFCAVRWTKLAILPYFSVAAYIETIFVIYRMRRHLHKL